MSYVWALCLSLTCVLLSVPVSCKLSFSNSSEPLCYMDESFALLEFKKSFTINTLASHCPNEYIFFLTGGSGQVAKPKTKSWKKESDCCEWDGVTCHPITGDVIGLDLSCAHLNGTIGSNSTLFQLRHLQTLNLAFNFFGGSHVSPEFGKFPHLIHLNLSYSEFQGTLSSEIGNLSRLASLDLSFNALDMSNFKVIVENLTALTQLRLDEVDIGSDIPQSLANRSALTYLSLHFCGMQGTLPSSIFGLPQLRVLTLGHNPNLYIDMHFGNWSNSIEILDLSLLNISKQLPYAPSKSLKRLYLNGCNMYGPIPPWVWNISEAIGLRDNNFMGFLPSKLPNLPSLEYLRLSSNNLSGGVKLNMFSESKDLRILDFSDSGLSVITTGTHELNSTLIWPHLEILHLSSCNIREFPSLGAPQYLWWLDLSNNNIQGEIPMWLHDIGDSIDASYYEIRTNLSHNALTHGLEHLPWKKLYSIDLSSNMLQGSLPNFPSNLILSELYASNNKLNGTIDPSICNLNQVRILDLSNNSLSGKIPLCLGNASTRISVLNLQSNRLNGTMPAEFSNCNFLTCLDLSDNQLEGVVPKSLSQCQSLEILNLGNNKFKGAFPSWLDSLPQLQILNLRFNSFHGPIVSLSKVERPFSNIQIIDISNNKFRGKLPVEYINHFTKMMNMNESALGSLQYMGYNAYSFSIVLTFNGREQPYMKIFTTMSTFDMSNNDFEGEIPHVIGKLRSLRGLNLSHNHLSGHIPPSIGNLSLLDCLDLSSNRLTGSIPQELVSLTFLGVFNVSDNILEGPIPQGSNFGTFTADSYKGNLALCGQPLPECGGSPDNTRDNRDAFEDEGSTLSMWEPITMGFGTGFVIVLAWSYYMFSVGKPLWFIRLIYKMELASLDFCDGHFGMQGGRARRTRT